MTDTLDLTRAYAIRAEIQAFIAREVGAGEQALPLSDAAEEMQLRHPDLTPDMAHHLVERVAENGGAPGLDYDEAPLAQGSERLRQWYPIERDGRLERVAAGDLSAEEFEAILAAMQVQSEWCFRQSDVLRRARRARGV